MTRYLWIGLLLLPLTGCVPVFSVYPLYTERDVVLEPALEGAWGDSAEAFPAWAFWKGKGSEYHVALPIDSTTLDSTLVGHLVRLRGALLLDLDATAWTPDSTERAFMERRYAYMLLTPVHAIFRVACTDTSLTLWYLDDEWLKGYLSQHPRSVRFAMVNDSPLLTGSTEEVRAFVARHLDEKDAFHIYGNPYVRCARSKSPDPVN